MIQPTFKGFASLQTPRDLLDKLQFDYDRFLAAADDPYAAFDFFVSSYHMLDWLHPGDGAARAVEEAGNPLLQVCSHIANGAKHFRATRKHHTSVIDVRIEPGYFDRSYFTGYFDVGGLVVELDGRAAEMFGKRPRAIELAGKLLDHWRADARVGSDSGLDAD